MNEEQRRTALELNLTVVRMEEIAKFWRFPPVTVAAIENAADQVRELIENKQRVFDPHPAKLAVGRALVLVGMDLR